MSSRDFGLYADWRADLIVKWKRWVPMMGWYDGPGWGGWGGPVHRRVLLGAAAATVVLAAAGMTAVAAAQGGSRHARWATSGMMRVPLVASDCSVPTALAGQVVTVMLGDMGDASMMGRWWRGRSMMLRTTPQTVRAGTVTLLALNHGTRTHELVVLPLANGAQVGTRSVGANNTVDESGSLGEASTSCGAGAGDGIIAGAASWVTLALKPGRYELVCNLPGHYATGMYTELDVT